MPNARSVKPFIIKHAITNIYENPGNFSDSMFVFGNNKLIITFTFSESLSKA